VSKIITILAFVFLLTGSSISRASVSEQPWVHIRYDSGQIKESWDNLQTGQTYAIRNDGSVVYFNDLTKTQLWYFKDSGEIEQDAPTIYAPGATPHPWKPQTAWDVYVAPVERAAAATQPAGLSAPTVVRVPDTLNGLPVIRFDSYWTDLRGIKFLHEQLWADPRTHLPVRIRTRLNGWSVGDYDFPQTGPADIFTLGVPRGTPIENLDAKPPDEVQHVLDAINRNCDDFLKNYRAVVTVTPDNSMPMNALDIIWRDGDKVRDDHHLPGIELQDHPAPPLPKPVTPEALVTWAAQHEPVAKQLMDSQREYVWFAANAKSPKPQVQITIHRDTPHLLDTNSWPDAIQWPTRLYSASFFHLLDANAETPAGCIGLRMGGEGNNRTDFYVDPLHDYVCVKQIVWNKHGAQWAKSRVLTLSGLRRIDGHIVADTRRMRDYGNPPHHTPVNTETTVIDLLPVTSANYPPGTFDPASLTTGADMIDQ